MKASGSNKLFLILRENFKYCLLPIWRWISRKKLLNRDNTVQILKDSTIYCKQHKQFILPLLHPLNETKSHFGGLVNLDNDYVWSAKESDQYKSLKIYRSGISLINNKLVLNVDFGSHGASLNAFPYRKKPVKYPIIVAPWSHIGGSYYEFVINILAKLCRVEEVMGKEIWKHAKVCYPLRNSVFERQYLEMLGISVEALIDSRSSHSEIHTHQLILANSQCKRTYSSPQDIYLLRRKILPLVKSTGNKRRLFFSRRGRRTILNESEVRSMLKEFDFEIIEDEQRSVKEQITLFREASFIIAPHGAALTNLLWCDPGTTVVECFSGGYAEPYYYYLSKVLGLNYAYMLDQADEKYSWFNTLDDIVVDINTLKKYLEYNFN